MIVRLLTLLLTAGAFCHAQPVRVVTWNLQWFPGKSPASNPEAAAAHIAEVRKALAEIRPDILVLQEVSGETPVAEAISVLPGFKVAVVSRFRTGSGLIDGQQIAICSKFPATHVFSAPWDRGWAGAPRGFAFAAFDCDGIVVNVYGLHLKSNLGDPAGNTAKREDAIEQLLKHQQEMQAAEPSAERWVVCGDFNTSDANPAVPSERTFPKMTAAGFYWTFDGVPFAKRITCPAKGRYPDACFDHVFVRGLDKPVASPLGTIGGSDHLPVSVDLDLRAKWTRDGMLRSADESLLERFADAKEQRQSGKLSAVEYAAAVNKLRSRELEIFAAVRNHEFKNLTESNYWHRGRLKFPSSIEMELQALKEPGTGTPRR